MDMNEVVKLLLPVIAIQFGIQIWALVDLLKRKKTRNLSVVIWVLIIILGEILGPVLYFLVGKAED